MAIQNKKEVRYRIDLPKSYRVLEGAVDRYNAQFKKPKLKLPHVFLARELIRLYAMEFQRWQAARGFAVELDWEKMPLLATNNQFLSDITARTGRSIRNYRKTLEDAGFFAPVGCNADGEPAFSIFHGRTSDFEIAILPSLIWIESNRSTGRLTPKNSPTLHLRGKNIFFFPGRKNFPPTSTGTVQVPSQQEQHELVGGKKSSDAEKNCFAEMKLLENSASGQQEPQSGIQPEQPEPGNRNEQSNQQAEAANQPMQPEPGNRNEQSNQQAGTAGQPMQPEPGNRNEQSNQQAGAANQPTQPEPENRNEQSNQQAEAASQPTQPEQLAGAEDDLIRQELIRYYASVLFSYAKNWLYPNIVFTQGREQAVLARLSELFGTPKPLEAVFEKITRNYLDRMKLIKLYWEGEHGAIPEPEIFFSTANPEGFLITRSWIDNPEKYPPQTRKTLRIQQHRRVVGERRNATAMSIGDIVKNIR
ncbi:MAG: hypothetical protein H6573_34710 [Lewinellaceae bacterium]|nr:hypothetical protein [Lewinellaceae bacterium]